MTGSSNYTGVFSHKFPLKTGLSKDMVHYLIKNEDVDVISFCQQEVKGKSGRAYKYLEFTEIVHPGFRQGFDILCNHLGLIVQEPKCVIYSNFWVAKPEVYHEYISTILIPAVEFLEREESKWFTWKDSGYKGLPKDQLKIHTELDYYPMITFLTERLPSVWIDNKGLTFKILNKL